VLSPRGVHQGFPAWRNYREYGGGGVTDWGAHHFDIVQWAFGMDESGPIEFIPAAEPNARSGVRFRYATGAEVTHKSGNGITFYGDKGKIYVNRGRFELWLGEQSKTQSAGQAEQMYAELLPANPVRLYKSTDHSGDWLNSIRTRKPPICDVEIGARTVTVCHLVNLCYYHGQPLKWDPKTEKFVDGTGKPEWLTREYRQPWMVI
jgi:predicted dehydrogenase